METESKQYYQNRIKDFTNLNFTTRNIKLIILEIHQNLEIYRQFPCLPNSQKSDFAREARGDFLGFLGIVRKISDKFR